MSVESMAIVLHHSPSSGTDKVVLLGIANHDGDGGAWPSIGTLAKYANVTKRNVQKSIDRLASSGQITRHIQAGGTRDQSDDQRPNRYDVNVVCPEDCDRTKNHRKRRAPAATPPPVAGDTPPPVASDTPPLSLATPEPSYEPSGEPSFRDDSGFSSSSSLVTREIAPSVTTTKTPDDHLEAEGMAKPDRGRYREYLKKFKNARDTDGSALILHMAKTGELASSIKGWRRSLDLATEPDAEPVLCRRGHGFDVSLGEHMCPPCRAASAAADVEPVPCDHGYPDNRECALCRKAASAGKTDADVADAVVSAVEERAVMDVMPEWARADLEAHQGA